MSSSSAMTEEIRRAIGMEFGPYVYEVEKGAIKKIAEAIGDPNPLWHDEEYAGKSCYGSIIAPPTFLFSLRFDEMLHRIGQLPCPLKREVNGGNEIEYFQPFRPGDVITVRAKLHDVRERDSRSGKLLLFFIDLTYENQRGKLVAKHRY